MLSVLCFIAAINSVVGVTPGNVKLSPFLFHDLIVFYLSSEVAVRCLQAAVDMITSWTHECGFNFSEQKSIVIHFI